MKARGTQELQPNQFTSREGTSVRETTCDLAVKKNKKKNKNDKTKRKKQE